VDVEPSEGAAAGTLSVRRAEAAANAS